MLKTKSKDPPSQCPLVGAIDKQNCVRSFGSGKLRVPVSPMSTSERSVEQGTASSESNVDKLQAK